MKLLRYLSLAAVAFLLGLGGSIGSFSEGALAQAQRECAVTVQPGESIQAAIDQAQEGDVICLVEGTWEENLKIEKSLTLRGADQEQTIIKGIQKSYPVIWIRMPEKVQMISVKIAGLTITGTEATAGTTEAFETRGACADPVKKICSHGIVLFDSAQVIISNSFIQNNIGGIVLFDSAQATISDSSIQNNDFGIMLGNSTQVIISNSFIQSNVSGIALVDSAQATISDSSIQNNDFGIMLVGSAQVTISNSFIQSNVGGIALVDSTQVTISDSSIQNNDFGIMLRDSAQAIIMGNRIEGHDACGISSFSSGMVQGEENEMADNGNDLCGNLPGSLRLPLVKASEPEITYPDERYRSLQEAVDALLPGGLLRVQSGIYQAGVTIVKQVRMEVMEGAKATLKGRSDGVSVLSLVGGAKLELVGLRVTGGEPGLLLGADARLIISESSIQSNDLGIMLFDSAQVTISNSSISQNNDDGIWLSGSAWASISESSISENNRNGIKLENSAQATISNSSIFQNNDNGIGLVGSVQVSISDSSIHDNKDGIELRGSAQVTISGSSISENNDNGIQLWGSAQVTISDSFIYDNNNGIWLWGSAEVTIEGNEIINNEDYGVALYQDPCFDIGTFEGHVAGKQNTVPGPGKPNGNQAGAVCPEELDFLMTEEGGEYP